VDAQLAELRDAVHGIRLLRHGPPRALDVTASFGERLSALIFAAYLDRFRPARYVDAREFVVTDDQFTEANVIFSKTNRAARKTFAPFFKSASRRVIPSSPVSSAPRSTAGPRPSAGTGRTTRRRSSARR
jgi:aspartokinase